MTTPQELSARGFVPSTAPDIARATGVGRGLLQKPSHFPKTPQEIASFGDEWKVFFSSFSGVDIQLFMVVDDGTEGGGRKIQPVFEIQTISISSARSVHPVRRLGESHAYDYTRGARTIAGTLVAATNGVDLFAKIADRSRRHERPSQAPFFVDEIPPFHILLTCINEYGQAAHAALSDVTLANFGANFSSDDMYLESTYTYVARFYHPLVPEPAALLDLSQDPAFGRLSYEVAKNTTLPMIQTGRRQTVQEMADGFWAGFSEKELEMLQEAERKEAQPHPIPPTDWDFEDDLEP